MILFGLQIGPKDMTWRAEYRALFNALHPTHNAWLRKLSGISRYLPDLVAASLVINILGLALPLTLLQVYDRILPNSSTDTLTALVIGVVITQMLEAVLRIARSSITAWTSARFEHMALNRAFNTLLRQPIDEFERKGTGAHNETISAINSLKEFYSGQAFLSIFDLPFAFLYLFLMAAFGGWMVMIPICLIAAFSVAAVVLGKKIREAMEKRIFSDDSRVNFLVEILSGIGTIKALAMEEQMRRRYERLLDNSAQAEFHAGELANKATAMAMLFSHMTTILVVSFGAMMVIDSGMTTGVLAACSLLAGRCVQPMQAALDRWTRFQAASLAEQRLNALLRNDSVEERPALPDIRGHVLLQDVGVSFDGTQIVLREVYLDAQPGDMIGISGENGSGKSSLLSLMSGSLSPTQGQVLLDGHDLSQFDPESIRRQVAYIPQRPELFRGTILDNLTLFDPTHREQAKEISRKLGIDRMVARMPLGYDTIVGEGAGDTLPRGIRQLIVIAQALVHQPKVILFDDANSAVDGAGDQLLRAHLESLKGHSTIILISSRPSLLNLAHRQYKLVEGRLLDTSKVTNLPNGAAPRDPVTSLPPGTPLPPRPPEAAANAAHNAHQIAAAAHGTPGTPHQSHAEPANSGRGSTDFLREIEKGSPLGRCLLPLLEAMDWQGNLRTLAESLPHFQNQLDIVTFRNVLASLGFNSSSEPMRGNALDARLLPCLLHTLQGDPIILTHMDEQNHVHGFSGQSAQPLSLSAEHVWGTLYLFTEQEAATPGTPQQQGQWFKKVLGRFYGLIWSVLGQSLIINLLALGMPFFTMSVYDKVIASGDVGMLVSFLAGVMIVIASDEVLRSIRYKATSYVGTRIGYIISSTVFERTLKLPLSFTERASIGSQLARFKDMESFRDFFNGGVASMLLDLPFVVTYLIVLTILGGPVALVPVVSLLIFSVLMIAMMPQIRKRVASSGRASTRRNEFMVETLLKMRALHAASLEQVWRNRFREYAAASAMGSSQSATLTGALATISQVLVILSGLATMAVGVEEVLLGNMTAGALIGSMMVVWRVLAPIQTGFSLMTRIEQTRSSIRQLESLVGFKTEGEGLSVNSNTDMQLRGAISFNRVSLRYSNDTDPALLGVNFEAKPGEVICILGPDGAGKSTLLKVLAGLYQPQAGNVTIDDLDIRQLDPIALRKAIGYAPQVPQMFFGTIAQNLRLAHPTASDEDLRWAMEAVGAWGEISALPQGLNTRVGDSRSNRMSPSLAQCISLARAYLKRSPILLLDEPVTGLDFEGDRHFRNFIESMRGKATILIVTHRPSHFNLADQILVMERGAIRLAGPAEEVKAKLAGR